MSALWKVQFPSIGQEKIAIDLIQQLNNSTATLFSNLSRLVVNYLSISDRVNVFLIHELESPQIFRDCIDEEVVDIDWTKSIQKCMSCIIDYLQPTISPLPEYNQSDIDENISAEPSDFHIFIPSQINEESISAEWVANFFKKIVNASFGVKHKKEYVCNLEARCRLCLLQAGDSNVCFEKSRWVQMKYQPILKEEAYRDLDLSTEEGRNEAILREPTYTEALIYSLMHFCQIDHVRDLSSEKQWRKTFSINCKHYFEKNIVCRYMEILFLPTIQQFKTDVYTNMSDTYKRVPVRMRKFFERR